MLLRLCVVLFYFAFSSGYTIQLSTNRTFNLSGVLFPLYDVQLNSSENPDFSTKLKIYNEWRDISSAAINKAKNGIATPTQIRQDMLCYPGPSLFEVGSDAILPTVFSCSDVPTTFTESLKEADDLVGMINGSQDVSNVKSSQGTGVDALDWIWRRLKQFVQFLPVQNEELNRRLNNVEQILTALETSSPIPWNLISQDDSAQDEIDPELKSIAGMSLSQLVSYASDNAKNSSCVQGLVGKYGSLTAADLFNQTTNSATSSVSQDFNCLANDSAIQEEASRLPILGKMLGAIGIDTSQSLNNFSQVFENFTEGAFNETVKTFAGHFGNVTSNTTCLALILTNYGNYTVESLVTQFQQNASQLMGLDCLKDWRESRGDRFKWHLGGAIFGHPRGHPGGNFLGKAKNQTINDLVARLGKNLTLNDCESKLLAKYGNLTVAAAAKLVFANNASELQCLLNSSLASVFLSSTGGGESGGLGLGLLTSFKNQSSGLVDNVMNTLSQTNLTGSLNNAASKILSSLGAGTENAATKTQSILDTLKSKIGSFSI